VLSTAFGFLMVAAAEPGAHGPAFVAAIIAAIAVLAGIQFRPAATFAVLLTVLAIVASDSQPVFAALSGLCAAAYLVLRHGAAARVGGVTAPTVIGAVGFTFAGLIATAFPLKLPWLPLLAPLAVLGIYALATRPFFGYRNRPTR
jgi:hypothetical protein